jgi:tripeptide aminopeptidase
MENNVKRTLDLAIQIQQIPGPTFAEGDRAKFIRDGFVAEELRDIEIDWLGNVYGRWPGNGAATPLVITAHSDTVFPLETDLTFTPIDEKIYGPAIGDNSLGVAGLFGLLWDLKAANVTLPGDIWLVANVCEEGLGDLKGMRAVVDRFGTEALAYLVVEGMALGQIYHRGLGVQRYRITIKVDGGHSWSDFGNPSAIHELATLVTQIMAMEVPTEPRTSFNVGKISGGTSVNTIAAEASLELDLRSTAPESLQKVISQVETLVAAANRDGVICESEIIGQRPAGEIDPEHPLVQLAVDVLADQGLQANLNIGSTDSNIPLSRGYPSICIGLTNGKGAHTVNEFIFTEPLLTGLTQLTTLVPRIFEVLNP